MKTFLHLLSVTNLRIRRLALLAVTLVAGTLGTHAQSCQAWFMYTVDSTVSPNVVTMYDSSFIGSGTITNYQWQYNGTPVGTNGPNQTITVAAVVPSDFICLTITTDSGCVSTWCDTIGFHAPPCNGQVTFTTTHDSAGTYFFNPSISGFNFPVTYLWQSSNGQTGTTATYSTQFTSTGFYNVCLTVSDANACTAMSCDSIFVSSGSGCQGCAPHIYYVRDSVNTNLYTFYDTTTYLNTPTADHWQLNGVNQGSGSSVTVTLSTPGTSYNICRTVSVTGCTSNCTTSCLNIHTAQLPGISINYFDTDSSSINCMAPAGINFYLYGSLTGYSGPDTLVGIHVNFDDGTDTSFFTTHPQTYFYTNFTHIYMNPGTYTPQVIVYSPDSMYTDTSVIFNPFVITNTCGPVSGYVYLDNNQNCIFDTGDDALAHRLVYLSDGSSIFSYAYTDASGAYSFNVPAGPTYTVRVDTNGSYYSGNYTSLCPVGAVLTVSTVPSSNNNFFLTCPAGFDLSAHLSGWGFVPGRHGSVCVYPFDHRCGSPNGQVLLILDPLLTALPDSGGNYTISGDTVIWNLSSGSGNGYYQSLCVPVITSTSATIGDTVCYTAIILPIAGDSVPANNTVTQCLAVRGSWDPNDKSATPEGAGANHAIRPETELTYTVRFQNTGTASAQDIFILDTLDANFDISTLEVLAASHPMVPAVLNGNILRFTFDHINLPDSNANEQMSHGYVMYRITPAAGIANGTVLHNTAGIYFDYNPVVRTNTTFHSIDITLGVHQAEKRNNLMTVYPNPANNMLHVRLAKPGITDLNIYDVTGRILLHQKMTESGSIDVKFLPAGSYKVQVLREEGIQNASFIIVR